MLLARLCALVLTLVAAQGLHAQVAFPLGAGQADDARAIAVDASGNSHVTGRFRLTMDADPGPGTVNLTSSFGFARYVIGYSASGAVNYAIAIDGATSDAGASIAVDAAGNVYVTSSFVGAIDFDPGPDELLLNSVDGRIFVASYDPTGHLRYAVNFGIASGTTELGLGIAVNATGTSYVTGAFAGETDFDPTEEGELLLEASGITDVFLASFTDNGGIRFAIGVGGTLADRGNAIAIDGAGNSYITGVFTGSGDFDPDPGQQLLLTSGGGEDIFVASYDDDGNLRYAFGVGDSGVDRGLGIALDGAANAFVTGFYTGTVDFDPGAGSSTSTSGNTGDLFLASYTALGALRFAFGVGNDNPALGRAAAVDASGNVHITGELRPPADFDPGPNVQEIDFLGIAAIVASYTNTGEYRNVYAYPRIGSGSSSGYGIALDASGDARVVGDLNGTVDGDPGPASVPVSTNGAGDGFYSSYVLAPTVNGPGTIPDASLRLDKNGVGPDLRLDWSASCTSATVDYGIFEGALGSFTSHTALDCSDDSNDLTELVNSSAGDRYYLVVPLATADEGSYGRDSAGTERPVGVSVCRAAQDAEICP